MSTTRSTAPPVDEIAARLKVLADPTRLRIFDLLMGGERCNCEMGGLLGLAPNLISHHLGVLRGSGLVVARRDTDDARWIYYSIDRAAVDDLVTVLSGFFTFDRRTDRDAACCPPNRIRNEAAMARR